MKFPTFKESLWFVLFAILFSTFSFAELTILPDYELVSSKRVSRTDMEFTYKVTLENTGDAVTDAVATVTSSSPHTTIVEAEVFFGDVDAAAIVNSEDTFALRQNRRYRFDPSSLSWSIAANPVEKPIFVEEIDGEIFYGKSVTDENNNEIFVFASDGATASQIEFGQDLSIPSRNPLLTNGFIEISGLSEPTPLLVTVKPSGNAGYLLIFDSENELLTRTPYGADVNGNILFRVSGTKVVFAITK